MTTIKREMIRKLDEVSSYFIDKTGMFSADLRDCEANIKNSFYYLTTHQIVVVADIALLWLKEMDRYLNDCMLRIETPDKVVFALRLSSSAELTVLLDLLEPSSKDGTTTKTAPSLEDLYKSFSYMTPYGVHVGNQKPTGEKLFAQNTATTPASEPIPTWEELSAKIVGHTVAKKAIKFAVDSASSNAELLKRFGRNTPKGMLLYGPPGTGKTMLARLAWEYLETKQTTKAKFPGFFILEAVKNKWYGESEKRIRDAFTEARAWSEENGAKAVLFIDEAEDLLARRGTKHVDLVPTFLAEMDNVDTDKTKYNPYVILATNRADAIDEAILRPGRIDARIEVLLPVGDEVEALFALNFGTAPFVDGYSSERAAKDAVSFTQKEVVVPTRTIMMSMMTPEQSELLSPFIRDVTLAGKLSGAVVAGLVDQVKTIAIERAISGGGEGITKEDVMTALRQLLADAKRTPLNDVLIAEFTRVVNEAQAATNDKITQGTTPTTDILSTAKAPTKGLMN